MRRPLSLALAQPPCTPRDPAANAEGHAAMIRAAGARVVVFPELSLTGYELDADPVDPADPRLAPLVAAARDADAIALVGAPVAGAAGKHIGVLEVTGDGVRVAYRKMFLGGAEPQHCVPGVVPAVLAVDGWRLGLAVCKDTGVPEHSAATAALEIDAYVAGVLDAPHELRIQEERAARITRDHRVWVALASFAGSTGGGYDEAAGCSRAWGPNGDLVAQAGPEVGAILPVTLT
ncbi:MAG: carbon-nitrogen hydrolase family protein [Hamadaea sp.]|nr:carbon-nitrogen hydrolase family protein [Hamadaea sp.]